MNSYTRSFPSRYGEPAWNQQPTDDGAGIQQLLVEDKSYEELRHEATMKFDTVHFAEMNKSAVTADSNYFVNLKNVTELVQVIVSQGEHETTWVIHRPLLEKSSKFISAMFKHDFKEKQENLIRLGEEDVDAFDAYVKFIYTGCIIDFSIQTIVKLYTLADRLQAQKCADSCFDVLAAGGKTYTPEQIKYVFDNTTQHDRLRKLCVNQVGKGIIQGNYSFSSEKEREMLSEYMAELMQGVTLAVANRHTSGWTPKAGMPDQTSSKPFNFPPAPKPATTLAPSSFSTPFVDPVPRLPTSTASPFAATSPFGHVDLSSAGNLGSNVFGNPTPQNTQTSIFGNPAIRATPNNTSGLFGSAPIHVPTPPYYNPSIPRPPNPSSQTPFGNPSRSLFGNTVPGGFGSSSHTGFGSSTQTGFGSSSQTGFGLTAPSTATNPTDLSGQAGQATSNASSTAENGTGSAIPTAETRTENEAATGALPNP